MSSSPVAYKLRACRALVLKWLWHLWTLAGESVGDNLCNCSSPWMSSGGLSKQVSWEDILSCSFLSHSRCMTPCTSSHQPQEAVDPDRREFGYVLVSDGHARIMWEGSDLSLWCGQMWKKENKRKEKGKYLFSGACFLQSCKVVDSFYLFNFSRKCCHLLREKCVLIMTMNSLGYDFFSEGVPHFSCPHVPVAVQPQLQWNQSQTCVQ